MADKLKMGTKNLAEENYKKLIELFPNIVTEATDENDHVVRAIDVDLLQQEINEKVVEGTQERYVFMWPDKKRFIALGNEATTSTLRLDKEKSTGRDGTAGSIDTGNIYIEGDNLEALKLLRETYLGKIKVIYIDPPYNTGRNLIYMNNFWENEEDFEARDAQTDEHGNRLVQNTNSNGRFHTDWLNMLYPRLRIAKDLLREDGYISIAIDDNELYNCKKIADEIFGETNYIGTIVTRCNPQGRNKNNIDPVHEYHLFYARNILMLPLLKIKNEVSQEDSRYLLRSGTNSRKYERPLRFYPMLVKDGKVETIEEDEYKKIYNPQTGFDDAYLLYLKNKYEALGYTYILPVARDGEEKVWQRTFDRVKRECHSYFYENGQIKMPPEESRTPVSLWSDEKYSNVAYGTNQIKALFGSDSTPFDFPKSVYTVKDIISLNDSPDALILDFFSGSATTAHAVMQLNAEDGGHRKFILVQLSEECGEDTWAYKAGYKTICDIGEERIRRAGKKIKGDSPLTTDDMDIGFRVYRVDSSNMKDVYYKPNKITQDMLEALAGNIKEDRTGEDLLIQIMLELGVDLSSKIEETEMSGKKVFSVSDGYMTACFDNDVTDDVVTQIAKTEPYYAVFRDSGMASDSVMTNYEQIFKIYSPKTIVKVL